MTCDSQSPMHRQAICSTQWLILCVMMHNTCNIAFATTDVACKILTFLEVHYLKHQIMAE